MTPHRILVEGLRPVGPSPSNRLIHPSNHGDKMTENTSADSARLAQALAAQNQGQWAEAEELYRTSLAEDSAPDAATLSHFGHCLRQLGKHEEASTLYARVVAQPDAPAAAWFNMGNVQFDLGQWKEAQASFAQALTLDAHLGPAALQRARCAVKLGEWAYARECFAAVLRVDKQNFSAWLEAGHLCRKLGVPTQALACYRHAVQARPGAWLSHATLARALEEAQEWDQAAMHSYRAQTSPDAEKGLLPLRFLAQARIERGDAHGAVAGFAHALSLAPEHHATMIDLGNALMRAGDEPMAKALFEAAGCTRSAEVLTTLAGVLFKYNFWEEAEALLRRLGTERPEDWSVQYNLAKLLIESWRMEEGLECLAAAEHLSAKPLSEARSMRASVASKLGQIDRSLELYKAASEAEGPYSPARSSAAMASLYSDAVTGRQVADLHRELFAPLGEGARQQFANQPDPHRRLRIGYVTADLHRQHPVNLFMQPVLARHDATRFEVTVYFVGVNTDEYTRLAKSNVARWRDAQAMSDMQLAQTIAEDGIDVLIDLVGHTGHNRRGLFAQRAAPVQASFLGYPGSTGIPNMDWLIADAEVVPEEDEALCSERVARLPHCVFCYSPTQTYPYPAYGREHAERPLTFGSFNNIVKLTPKTISLWAKVLQAVPDSRLFLKAPSFSDPGAVRRFTDVFVRAGVEASRLEFAGPTGLDDMMAEYERVDIALDTVPYNGGTTTYQALWMGVPVLALEGRGFCQRMGASILKAIGRPEWLAADEDDYVEMARRVASDRAALLAAKQGLRERMIASPALDIDQYTADLEQLMRGMWVDWCDQARIANEQPDAQLH
ncbi:tetratricopeptide repeat protein [Variovorax saccharolyticus]|uniref:tetratricopeptide repeat protein n=1 Tax=Variovorax saccharolyticus TaxID=3053516 RepID=UPI0025779206|nr:tetratricopeptide repeat protein [Variovorax sp. J31P216]MDM0029871.1 tetratricopeptide repeat protein [Variovorax sp. J31P216]